MTAGNPKLDMDLTELCTRTIPEQRYVPQTCSGSGNNRICTGGNFQTYYITQNDYMNWDCDSAPFANKVDASTKMICNPGASYFGDFSGGSLLLNALKQKKFMVEAKLASVDPVYIHSIGCAAGQKPDRILRFTQGVQKRYLDDHVVFHMAVNGQNFDFDNSTGVLNDDVEYCGDPKSLSVSVNARANFMFLNAGYKPSQDRVELNSSHPEASIDLNRVTFPWEKLFGYQAQSDIKVQVIDPKTLSAERLAAIHRNTNRARALAQLEDIKSQAIAHSSDKPNGGSSASTQLASDVLVRQAN